MKAEELRIGNLYEATDGSRISFATGKDLYAWDQGAIYGKPIPLTEEWLTKAGFKPWGTYDYLWKKGRNHACTIIQEEEFKGGKEWFELRGVKNGHVIIEYVHQLQNLYFPLTGEELKFEL